MVSSSISSVLSKTATAKLPFVSRGHTCVSCSFPVKRNLHQFLLSNKIIAIKFSGILFIRYAQSKKLQVGVVVVHVC